MIESSEMSKSNLHKIIDYSEKLQSMIDPKKDLEDWVKAKLTHAADYLDTVFDYLSYYNEENSSINENLHLKYKKFLFLDESYKSEMAIGDLKNINHKAKLLQSIIDPKKNLEDWVKSKLNLAGEYLDDIFHHIDYFDQDGREYDDLIGEKFLKNEDKISPDLNEGFKEIALATLIGLGTIGSATIKNVFANSNVKPTVDIIKNTPVTVYSVQSGDSLSRIAKKSNVSLRAILKANPGIKDPNRIKIGDEIIIPVDETGKVFNIKSFKNNGDDLYSDVNNKDIVAATVVDEAGGESDIGMQAVLNVILNRGNGNIKDAAVASLKKMQFSGWNNVARNSSSISKFIDKKKRHPKYQRALEMVTLAQDGKLSDVTNGADHFLNPVLTKKWNKGRLPSWYTKNRDKITKVIGKHEFLKLK